MANAATLPEMTMDEFNKRADAYVEATVQDLKTNDLTKGQYDDGPALREDLRKGFHKIIVRHYVLVPRSAS